jgi:hypothetical protein
LSDLTSLREVELSSRLLPEDKKDYEGEEWFTLMSTLRVNDGVLRIVILECESTDWFYNWSLSGGRNFSCYERILLKTSFEVHDWNELVVLDLGNFNFSTVFLMAMTENWIHGPLKFTTIHHQESGRKFGVKFWGVPEDVRRSKERKEQRQEAEKAAHEKRKAEASRRGRLPAFGMERLKVDDDEDNAGRHRRTVTREEARKRRMKKQRSGR